MQPFDPTLVPAQKPIDIPKPQSIITEVVQARIPQESQASATLSDYDIVPEVDFSWGSMLTSAIGDVTSFLQPHVTAAAGTLANAALGVAYVGGAAAFTLAQGVSTVVIDYASSEAAAQDATLALSYFLPEAGFYESKIVEMQKILDDRTGDAVCSQACKALSKLMCDYIEKYPATVCEPSPFLGQVITKLVETRRGLVEETAEINLLRIVDTITATLKEQQEKDPHFLAKLVQETML